VAGRIERLLATLRELPDDEPAAAAALERALASESGPVVAAAARIVRSRGYAALHPLLEAAFAPLVAGGHKVDPSCSGKAALVEALAEGDAPAWHVYLAGAATIQREPVWADPPYVDTAGEVRARSLLALVHTRYPGALDLVAEALADPLARVRIAAAQALGDSGAVGATAVLRFKIALGDLEPEVTGAAVGSLLALDATAALGIAERLLAGEAEVLREHVGLALGSSREPRALPLLEQWWTRAELDSERETALVAIALLRSADGVRFLVGLVAARDRVDGRAALKALAPFAHDPTIATAVAEAATTGAVTAEDLGATGFA
jgi:hypothetical protein